MRRNEHFIARVLVVNTEQSCPSHSPRPDEAGDVAHRGQREASIRGREALRADWMMRSPEQKLNIQRNKHIGPADRTKRSQIENKRLSSNILDL